MTTLSDFNIGDGVEYNPQNSIYRHFANTPGVVLGCEYGMVRVEWDKTSALYITNESMRTLCGARMCPGWIKLAEGRVSNIPEPLCNDLI